MSRPVGEVLAELGISLKETAVYLALLEQGPSSVRQLASATGINRGTVYDALKHLQELTLVQFYNRETKQYFVAAPPSRLRELADIRATELKKATEELGEVVAELEIRYNSGLRHPVARMYEGAENIRTILEDVLETMSQAEEKEYYIYSSSTVKGAGLYIAFPDYTEQRIKRGISVKSIGIGEGGATYGLDERKQIPGLQGSPAYTLIYGNKVAKIFLDRSGQLVGLIIENPGIYETQKLLFLTLWERL